MRRNLVMTRRRNFLFICAIHAVGYLFLATFLEWALVSLLGRTVPVTPAFVLVTSMFFGPAAAWGAGLGHLGFDALIGGFGVETGVKFVALIGFGLIAYELLAYFTRRWSVDGPRDDPIQIGVYLVVAWIASGLAAAFLAWGYEALSVSPFSVTVTQVLMENAVSTTVLGLPMFYLGFPYAGQRGSVKSDVTSRSRFADLSSRPKYGIVLALVAIVWCLVGYGLSISFQALDSVYPPILRNQAGPFVIQLLQLGGPGGSTFLMIMGGVFLVVVVVLMVRIDDASPSGVDPPPESDGPAE